MVVCTPNIREGVQKVILSINKIWLKYALQLFRLYHNCVFEMSFVKNALLTMEYGVFIISESGNIKIKKQFKII